MIDEESRGKDPFLVPFQAGLEAKASDVKFGARGSIYHYGELNEDFYDLAIYANDIHFSKQNPEPYETFTVTVRNHDGGTVDGDGCSADCKIEDPMLITLESFHAEFAEEGVPVTSVTPMLTR